MPTAIKKQTNNFVETSMIDSIRISICETIEYLKCILAAMPAYLYASPVSPSDVNGKILLNFLQ